MENKTFRYSYSATQNKEVESIRNRYLPKEENKIEILKKLDSKVQSAGMIESLCLGIVGTVCVIGFAAGLYAPVFKARFKKCDRAVTSLALAATVGVLAHGIFDETITWPAVAVIFFFILAGSAAYLKEKN